MFGLPGLLCTLGNGGDIEKKEIHVYGPLGLRWVNSFITNQMWFAWIYYAGDATFAIISYLGNTFPLCWNWLGLLWATNSTFTS